MSAASRLFLAELRAERPSAIRRLRAALQGAGGSVTAAAAELGVGTTSLYRAAAAAPAVRRVLEQHGLGREGAAERALESRGITRASGAGEKK